MVIEPLGRLLRASNIAPLDDEARRICAALIHIEAHGNLDRFLVSRNARRALFETASRRQLVQWRRSHSRFELTKAGKRLAARSLVGQRVSGSNAQEFPQPRKVVKFRKLTGMLVGAVVCIVFAGLLVARPFDAGLLDSAFIEDIPPSAHTPLASTSRSTEAQPEGASCLRCPVPPKRGRPATALMTAPQATRSGRENQTDVIGLIGGLRVPLRPNASSMQSACLPTACCRMVSATCSSGQLVCLLSSAPF
jgi:hypothetical protein